MRIRNGFDEFVCLRSNLSNDNIISALRPGLKTGLENYIFWSEIYGAPFVKILFRANPCLFFIICK